MRIHCVTKVLLIYHNTYTYVILLYSNLGLEAYISGLIKIMII